MYRALYDYQATDQHALSISKGDRFTVVEATDEHWWMVQNGFGEIGYVPNNYLEKDEVAHTEVIKSIDRAIEAIHYAGTNSAGQYTHQQRNNLQKLLQHRKQVVEQHRIQRQTSLPKRHAPGPPLETTATRHSYHGSPTRSTATVANKTSPTSTSKKSKAPPIPQRGDSCLSDSPQTVADSQTVTNNDDLGATFVIVGRDSLPDTSVSPMQTGTPPKTATDIKIPQGVCKEIVELVRRNTNLSHLLSETAVKTVLLQLHDKVDGLQLPMEKLLEDLESSQTSKGAIDTRYDAVRLNVILSEMESCKDDSQQRSWALHEDEAVILEYLNELLSILENAEQSLCCEVLSRDHYSAVSTLVLYYQMETRTSIRLVMLKVFGSMCGLEAPVISELLNSVLPVELARDIQTNLMNKEEIERVTYSTLVLTMILSQGEPVPHQHYTILDQLFVEFLLDNVDSPPEDEEQIPELFVNLILAFNLHFQLPEENKVMDVLKHKGTAKSFTERVMLLVNRGDDPVRMFSHEPKPPDSLLKLLSDLYSRPETSGLLYTNDAMVLIDIIIRHLCDLPPGDQLRTEYLSLVHQVVRNSSYGEYTYRRTDLESCFNKIICEEDKESEMDRLIVKQIYKEFKQYFKVIV